MKRFLATLCALAFLISQASASNILINPYVLATGVSPPASISFVGCTASVSANTVYTFTNHATGTAGARKTIVSASAKDNATIFSIDSMTVGGVSATEVVDNSADTGSLVQNALYIIDNPSGTTATIVVTASESMSNMTVCVWAAYDLLSTTATATASQFQTASAAITLSLNVSTDGIGVGISSVSSDSDTATWTGLTERVDALAESGAPGEVMSYSGADTATAGTPLSVTADWTGTDDSAGVSASFR